uniref:C2 domain-containing protein n=1 Tax=Marmota marmota marmota TaxID=9994 RepID=A0A8C5ZAE5_MARMA
MGLSWCNPILSEGPLSMRLLGKLRSSAPEPAFSNVLTPGRIPEFCIPPRLSLPCPPESPPAGGAGRTDWDPRSQAALSLPHLPRALTAYGFCTLLESPHTRRKESLFLGDPRAAALLQPPAARPRAHTYGGNREGDVTRLPLRTPDAAPAAAPGCPCPPRDALSPRPGGRRLLRAPNGLLSRALRARRSRGLARARSASNRDGDVERGSASQPNTPAPCSPLSLDPRTKLVEAEGTVALGRAGCALRLAANYCPSSGRLRIRLLRAEGLAGGTPEPRALGCRISLVLQPTGSTRKQRSSVLRRSLKDAFDQDFCFDGLTEDQVRHLTVRVKAEKKGRGLERGRVLGQGELLLGSLLLL